MPCLETCCMLDTHRKVLKQRKKIEYDPDFKGPMKNRSCTDILCLGLFVVFIGCWIGVACYAYTHGDTELLLIPRDSSGSRCGFDPHVLDKPYLFFFDISKCFGPNVPFTGCNTPQICVSRCPSETFIWDNNKDYTKLICVDGVIPTTSSAEALVNNKKCTRWYLRSEQVLKRCVPAVGERWPVFADLRARTTHSARHPQPEEDLGAIIKRHLEAAGSVLSLAVHNVIGLFTDSDTAHQFGNDFVEDLRDTWPEMLGFLALGIFACMLYIFIMRWIAKIMVWLTIFGTIALLAFSTYLTAKNYDYYKKHPYDHENAKNMFEKYVKTKEFWLVLLIISSVVLALLLFVLIFIRKQVILAIALIKEGSKAVSAVTSALFFPIVPWLLQMAIFAFAISVGLYISTVGTPSYQIRNFDANGCKCSGEAAHYKDGVECTIELFERYCPQNCPGTCKFIEVANTKWVIYVQILNVFAFFWGVSFVTAFGEMVLAATFAKWYWTFKKSRVPFFALTAAVCRTLRYHIGTLAFGSLIIAICRMIRAILEYVDHKLKKYDNAVTKAVLCCCKCFFWCLETFLKFINKNAYIMCAIHGKNFCASAKDACSLLMRNIIRVAVLDKVTDFLFFLSKMLVSLGVASIVYSYLEFASEKNLHYPIGPAIIIFICTYLIACMFFSVYTMAVDTLFMCFLEDCERNDGSENRPYYMSTNLRNIFHKKNVVS
ncbi:choline transporter-like 2 isoform X2 [Atheta coriaria]|uniref:choline transporter-like 2 isoform X2 n=1 Tax=Dalotia coriaria TaxID=877792 RepID=UPI0031F3CCD9